MSGSRGALRLAAAAVFGQLVLQLLWHGWLLPSTRAALALSTLPLLPAVFIGLRNLRRGVLVGGIVSLFYFSHGVANLWTDPASRGWSVLEIVLSLAIIGGSYWDARGYKRRTT